MYTRHLIAILSRNADRIQSITRPVFDDRDDVLTWEQDTCVTQIQDEDRAALLKWLDWQLRPAIINHPQH